MNQKIRDLIEVAEMLKDPRVIPGDELDRLKEKATKYDLVLSWFDTNVEVFDDAYLAIGDLELTEDFITELIMELKASLKNGGKRKEP